MFKVALAVVIFIATTAAADVLKDKQTLSTIDIGSGHISSDGMIVWTSCDGSVTKYGPASKYIIRKGSNCHEEPSNQAPDRAAAKRKTPDDSNKADQRGNADKPD